MQSEYESDASAELKSESDSDEESGLRRNKRPKFPVFNDKTDMKSAKFTVGQQFTSVVIFRLAIRIQAIMDGRDVYFTKNDTNRVRVKYRGCGWEIFGSKMQGYRTLRKVRAAIERSHEKQYELLEDFCGELRRANPRSTVFVESEVDDEGISRFKRLYMCLEPLKRGYLAGCRCWIGMDGCFLKGPYGGQLLTAVGMNANNKMYPLTIAVVGVENYDNWSWFLGLLVQDLRISNSKNWCIMTNKQKGLVQAVRDKLPEAEHRCCAQHLYSNFKLSHRGLALKDRLWRCARASYVNQFKREMELLRQQSELAHQWLADKDPKTWSRSHFRVGLDCDILVNNMCESFNAVLLKARSLPIIGMLQTIYLYQVSCPFGEQFVVDMAGKTCSCRKWQLRGIPCGHAVACINRRHEQPEQHVSHTYLKTTYVASYDPVLNPINGPNLWEHINLQLMKPPNFGRSPGRPKKMRKRVQVKRQQLLNHVSIQINLTK
ncbi:uncharacterized protein [Coffea arabica]|uniref:SWIM-type domain-containing protein n=1 Tax=Coffea arabica TaxID=13443 RepID=A0ABM4UEC9_COFAR